MISTLKRFCLKTAVRRGGEGIVQPSPKVLGSEEKAIVIIFYKQDSFSLKSLVVKAFIIIQNTTKCICVV